jgi:hypothetical protein
MRGAAVSRGRVLNGATNAMRHVAPRNTVRRLRATVPSAEGAAISRFRPREE